MPYIGSCHSPYIDTCNILTHDIIKILVRAIAHISVQDIVHILAHHVDPYIGSSHGSIYWLITRVHILAHYTGPYIDQRPINFLFTYSIIKMGGMLLSDPNDYPKKVLK